MPTCKANGCGSSTRRKLNRENGIFFHEFPNRKKSPERFWKWVEYCKKPNFDVYKKNACLCSKHFLITDMDESQVNKIKLMPGENLQGPSLKPGTVPTVLMPSYNERVNINPNDFTAKHINDGSTDGPQPVKKPKPVLIKSPLPPKVWEEITTKKRKFSTSLMKWRDCLVNDQPKQETERLTPKTNVTSDSKVRKYHRGTQCEMGLEKLRYLGLPDHKQVTIKSMIDNNPNFDLAKMDDDLNKENINSKDNLIMDVANCVTIDGTETDIVMEEEDCSLISNKTNLTAQNNISRMDNKPNLNAVGINCCNDTSNLNGSINGEFNQQSSSKFQRNQNIIMGDSPDVINQSNSDSDSEIEESLQNTEPLEPNFAAFGSLLLLFRFCNACNQEVNDVEHGMKGNKIYVKSLCVCGNKVTWTSKPSK